jgi:hypothetical protein
MKKKLYTIMALLLTGTCFGQLTQDADGESSLLFKSTHIALDITKTELGFGWNNLPKANAQDCYPIWGLGVNARNAEGIGDLFSTGTLVPSSKGYGFLGVSFSNGVIANSDLQLDKVTQRMSQCSQEYLDHFYLTMPAIVFAYTDSTDSSKTKELQKELLSALKDKISIRDFKTKLAAKDGDSPEVKSAKEQILKKVNSQEKKHKDELAKLNEEFAGIAKGISETPFSQLMIFGFGGIRAMEFKTFSGFDTVSLRNSFQDQYFRGGFAGIGVNYTRGRFTLGVTYRYVQTNNFSALTKKTYAYKSVVNYGSQTLTEEKQITAYAGDYAKVTVNELQADFAMTFKLDDSATTAALINPYLRGQLFSRNDSLLPNTVDVGCGFYFFKTEGKFLGGFYVELSDVQNNLEKAKPIKDQNLREPQQRITFGVVTKFSFVSLIKQLQATKTE